MITLVPEVYFYYFHCEGERKNKPQGPVVQKPVNFNPGLALTLG
jgi:hypothetical protein